MVASGTLRDLSCIAVVTTIERFNSIVYARTTDPCALAKNRVVQLESRFYYVT